MVWKRKGTVAVSAAFIVLGLTGCSETALSARMARHARDDLLGLSRDGLIACAGRPVKQERIGDREFLTYVSDDGLPPESCVATFVLRRELVDRLDYSAPSGMLPKAPGACGIIVASCMPEEDAVKAGLIEEPQSGS
ncbi:MAG: hypothetical protein V3R77_10430 [Candidatus Binatia bacterium]